MELLTLPMSYGEIIYYSFPNENTYSNNSHAEFLECELTTLKTKAPLTVAIGNYAISSYEGIGVLFACDTLGNWYKWECGHCSCYGPLERGLSGIFTQEQVEKLMEEYPDILEFAKKNIFFQ